ncbi:MAG: hypothetical protein ACYDHC_13050 [Desulfuromonadaceae bacterium]
MNAIEIIGLCKQFTGKRMTKVDALKRLDLTIEAGEVFGFWGQMVPARVLPSSW